MNQLTIRRATPDDAVWIFDEIGEGVQAGHFSDSLLDDFQRMGLIAQVIAKNELRILKLRNNAATPVVMPADLWVAEHNGDPAGFLLSLIEGSKMHPDAIELHLGGTVTSHRKQGVFQAMLQHQISVFSRRPRIYARCYQGSTQAMAILQTQGFSITRMGDPIELTLS